MGRRAELEQKIAILCRIIPQIELEIEIIDENQGFSSELDLIYSGLKNSEDKSSGDISVLFTDKLKDQTEKEKTMEESLDNNSKRAKDILEEARQLLSSYEEELANLGPDE